MEAGDGRRRGVTLERKDLRRILPAHNQTEEAALSVSSVSSLPISLDKVQLADFTRTAIRANSLIIQGGGGDSRSVPLVNLERSHCTFVTVPVSYCTLLAQQFRLLLGFKCLLRFFF